MCAGAILHARLARLIYAAHDPKAGACGSVLSVLNHPALNHRVQISAGVLADLCGFVLTDFFRRRRADPSLTMTASAAQAASDERDSPTKHDGHGG